MTRGLVVSVVVRGVCDRLRVEEGRQHDKRQGQGDSGDTECGSHRRDSRRSRFRVSRESREPSLIHRAVRICYSGAYLL